MDNRRINRDTSPPKLYGQTNRMMAEINAHLLRHPDLGKFLYYTHHDYDELNILEQDVVSASELYDKHIFVYKRVPEVINEEGAYLFMNIYREMPTVLGGKIDSITFNIDILVHRDCLNTAHGNRTVCIYTAINKALSEFPLNSSIGNISINRVLPILGLIKDFEGYTLQYVAHGFRDEKED